MGYPLVESAASAPDPAGASRRSWLLHPVAPIATAGAAACAAVALRASDPAAPGNWLPACQFRAATGLWCPGCGLTRGLHSLLHGDLAAAVGFNVFTPIAVLAAAFGWWAWTRRALGRPALRLPATIERHGPWALLAVGLAFAVLRNIPAAPFDALAP